MENFGLEFFFSIKESAYRAMEKVEKKIGGIWKGLDKMDRELAQASRGGFRFERAILMNRRSLEKYRESLRGAIKDINVVYSSWGKRPPEFRQGELSESITGIATGVGTAYALKEVDDALEALQVRLSSLGYSAKDAHYFLWKLSQIEVTKNIAGGLEEAAYYLIELGVGFKEYGRDAEEYARKIGDVAAVSSKVARVFQEDKRQVAALTYELSRLGIDIFDTKQLEQFYSGIMRIRELGFNISTQDLLQAIPEIREFITLVEKPKRAKLLLDIATIKGQLQSLWTDLEKIGFGESLKGILRNVPDTMAKLQAAASWAGLDADMTSVRERLLRGDRSALLDILRIYKEISRVISKASGYELVQLEEQFGITKEQALKILKVDLKELSESMIEVQRAAKQGTAINEAYEQSLQNLSSQWGIFTGRVGRFFKGILSPVINDLANALGWLNEKIAAGVDKYDEIVKAISEFVGISEEGSKQAKFWINRIVGWSVVVGVFAFKVIKILQLLKMFRRFSGSDFKGIARFMGWMRWIFGRRLMVGIAMGITLFKKFGGAVGFVVRGIASLANLRWIGALARGLLFIVTKFNPVLLVVSTLATIGYLVYENWDKVKEVIKGVFDTIKKGIGEAVSFFGGFAGAVGDFLSVVKEKVVSVFTSIINFPQAVSEGLRLAFGSVLTFFKGMIGGIGKIYESIKEGDFSFSKVISSIKDSLSSAFTPDSVEVRSGVKEVVSEEVKKQKEGEEITSELGSKRSELLLAEQNAILRAMLRIMAEAGQSPRVREEDWLSLGEY